MRRTVPQLWWLDSPWDPFEKDGRCSLEELEEKAWQYGYWSGPVQEEAMEQREQARLIRQAINEWSSREQLMVRQRFGLDGYEAHTYEQ